MASVLDLREVRRFGRWRAYRVRVRLPGRDETRNHLGLLVVSMLIAALSLTACTVPAAKSAKSAHSAGNGSTQSTAPSTSASPSAPPSPTGAPVHIRLYESDGSTYGVGMPIIAYLSASITSAAAFDAATTVTVNGAPANGAWYFEKSGVYAGYPLEAHYRPPAYWPAHAKIEMHLATKDKSAGPGLLFDDSIDLSMATGAAQVATVDGATEQMTVTSDGTTAKVMPVSLGKASTPTFTGTKVVMAKNNPKEMISTKPGDSYDLMVPWSVRITNSGEFVHAASWNGGNIGSRSTSNGCTNLNTGDAQWYYNFSQIGDPVVYTNTGGGPMPVWDGYGDWNLPWATWAQGGVVPTQ